MTTNKKGELLASFAWLVAAILAAILGVYVSCRVWDWYVVPVFGVGSISMGQMFVLLAACRIAMHRYDPDTKTSVAIVTSIVSCLILWLVAYALA